MRTTRTNKVYVKGLKITNSNDDFTEEDFILLQEKLKIIRKLYLRPEVGCDCYTSFRAITKEIKRAAHNAGLKTEFLHLDYTCLSNNEISISGDSTTDINLLVFIKPVAELKGDNFTIAKLEMLSTNKVTETVLNIKLSSDMYSNIIATKYIYKGEDICVL